MKVVLVTWWDNVWVPYYRAAFERRGHSFEVRTPREMRKVESADLVLHGWAEPLTPLLDGAVHVMFVRGYELFCGELERIDWTRISRLICVNDWGRRAAQSILTELGVTKPIEVVYNGIDLERWSFKVRSPGKRLAMACHVHPKKNIPLAAQILARLPSGYSLHIAGEVQDPATHEYLGNFCARTRRKLVFYGHIPNEHMDEWWDQMHYCLSTSLREGNPNNVIEAAAKGIKPVVHNWPGAEQWPAELRFDTVEQAVAVIGGDYDSQRYRDLVQERFSLANIERVVDIALGEVRCT